MPTPLRFGVIGAGRLGASLALALRAKSAQLVGFTTHTAAGLERASALLGEGACETIAQLVARTPDLYVLTVPDNVLCEVANKLAQALDDRTAPQQPTFFVLHTSGATSVAILEPCVRAGARALAFHPLQTFSDPATGASRFPGTAIAITPFGGSEQSTEAQFGFSLARLLGGVPFFLRDDRRVLYHAAATLACNYFIGLEHQARRLFVLAGLPEQSALGMFMPLVKATLENIERQGTVKALTGPLSRGDAQTVLGHLQALKEEAPDLSLVYAALGLVTLDIVRERKEVPEDVLSKLEELLEQEVTSSAQPRLGPDERAQ